MSKLIEMAVLRTAVLALTIAMITLAQAEENLIAYLIFTAFAIGFFWEAFPSWQAVWKSWRKSVESGGQDKK
ncbi:MAG: hypothetical protein AAB467_05280 [Patescibacteria group bacterium]